jgi:hypothetical protein
MHGRKRSRLPLDLAGLSGRVEIFRVTGAVERDRVVDAWLTGEPHELRAIAQTWFMHMRQCGDDVRELLHDGCPVACVADAPFAYVNSFKSHVNVGFFYGAMLEDAAGLLEGNGKRMRHIKLKPGQEPNHRAIRNLIVAAHTDVRARIAAELCGNNAND